VVRTERLYAVEPSQEVEVPHGAPELAVGRAPQADVCLPGDDAFDGCILGGGELGAGALAAFASCPRLLEGRGPQEAAYVVGAKRRSGSNHSSPGNSNGRPV